MKHRTISGDLADMHPSITPDRITESVKRNMSTLGNPGIRLACGTDARHFGCDSCRLLAVCGAGEVLLMVA